MQMLHFELFFCLCIWVFQPRGANAAAEAIVYASCVGANVLFFECNPAMAVRCRASAESFGQRCVQGCLSNAVSKVPFFVSDNDGMSSSLRPFNDHSVVYPGVSTSSVLDVWTTRYDQWVEQVPAGLLPPRMNVLVVDVQGMDLEVLEGMGSHLESFDVLLIEVSSVELYAGQRLANATDAFLKARGFHCHLDCGPCKHCDRLYRRDNAHHSAANIALDLRGFDNFDAFSAAVRPNLLRFCVNNYQLEQNSESKAASHDVMSSSSVGVAAQILPGTEEESRNRHASSGRSSEGSQAARGDAREDTKEASIAACAAELEAYLNWHVIDACDDFDDDDAALPA